MATKDLGATVREMYDAWNAKDMDRCASYAHADARIKNVPFGAMVGFREYIEGWARAFPDGGTLREIDGIWYSISDRRGGRAPDELDDPLLLRLGRLIARVHNVGAQRAAPLRPRLDADRYVRRNLAWLRGGERFQREFRREGVAQLLRRHYELAAPVVAVADVHVLDEAHHDARAAEVAREVERLAVVDAALHDRVDLDGRKPGFERGADAVQHAIEPVEAAAHPPEGRGVDRVEAHGDAR